MNGFQSKPLAVFAENTEALNHQDIGELRYGAICSQSQTLHEPCRVSRVHRWYGNIRRIHHWGRVRTVFDISLEN